MDEAGKTSGAQHIEQLMQQLPQDSERYRVLASARQFKSSWVELGEWLARVCSQNRFADWGYTTFEDYCSKEIRIRKTTAEKLLLAYRFLERKEPGLLERREGRPLPDYRSVDLLRQAEEEKPFSATEYGELRAAVIEQERSHPTVARQFRDIDHAYRPEMKTSHHYRNALLAARRLATSLQEISDVPHAFSQALAEMVGFLEEAAEAARVTETSETSGTSELQAEKRP